MERGADKLNQENELEVFENRKQKENLILFILTMYGIGMTGVSFILSWATYVPVVICVGLFLAWVMCMIQYKDFYFRANVLAIISLLDFTMYGVRAGSLYDLLTPMAAVAILLGITALPDVLRWVNLDTAFLCFYHIFVLKTVPFITPLDKCRAGLILISIVLIEGVSYFLMIGQQKLLKRMQDVIDQLKAAENSKSDFLSNVSHEIRTPVNVVCGLSEMMLLEDLTPKLNEDVHDLQMAGRNLQRLISDFLDFTELQSGNFSIVEETYNLTSTVNDVMNMTVAQIGTKNIEFVVDCDAGIPRGLLGDEQKIRRIMINILNNAVKFTPEGCIYLDISYRKESYGVNLVVSIRDTGIGIKKENLEKIFSNFNQVDTRKNRQEGGIGLGLAISRALVTKMGGFIKIDSELGRGTRVQFVVPQKVLDEAPMIEVTNPREKKILGYINLEKYIYALTRESYSQMLQNMAEQLQLYYMQCRNLDEMKRRLGKENYTHIFLGWEEYLEDSEFFDELAEKMLVFLIIDRKMLEQNEEKFAHSKIFKLVKPFYALSIATVLNGKEMLLRMNEQMEHVHFTAPEVSVLVVDDSLMNLKVVEGLLRPYQIKVFTAESGTEALEKIERADFDFVFMDHMMPEMDGVETLHKIRKKPGNYFQNIPIIALTANAVGGAREMFLQEGFQDFISKPIELPVLERILKKYIPDSKKIKTDETPYLKGKNTKQEKLISLSKVAGVDMQMGIQYSGGSVEDYLDIINIYCSEGRRKLLEIQKDYEVQNWENYAILVHALKSTSMGIGAESLSEQAKALEEAGKEENVAYICANHDEMIHNCQTLIEELEDKMLKKSRQKQSRQKQSEDGVTNQTTEEKREIPYDRLETLLTQLQVSFDAFETDGMEAVLQELTACTYKGRELQSFADKLKELTDVFNFTSAADEVHHMKEEMNQ